MRGARVIKSEQIGKRIAEAIRQSGLTQTAIAKELNISQSTIAHYIKGDILPALDTFANLCKLLDIDTNYILCQE
ncbi:MAG: helix-turn-helix domain-containing protein [Clostridiales bacterium]|nr:helix-turn-helix domain-containing protein [Clostridiales bacterium]